jgi:hypothetical protein
MTSPAVPQVPWWLDRAVMLPILYAFFGASLGFVFGRLKDWFDERGARSAFLEAIRVELATVAEHLKGTLKDATECNERLEKGERKVLHLATAFQTAIFISQVGKLKSVADPLLIEIIRFYDKLSNLEMVKSHFTSVSFELTRLTTAHEDYLREGPLASQYRSALDEIIKRINELFPVVQSLLAKIQE